jgi:hypothetical protein
MDKHRTRVIGAGATYFAVVFAAGFALGTVRVLLLVPPLGEVVAGLIELPVMLGISWIACAKVVARFQVPSRVVPRLAMGAVAFGLLMLAEVMLSVALFGRPMNDFVQGLTTLHGMIGLGGQVLFGLMPVVLDRTSTPKSCGR